MRSSSSNQPSPRFALPTDADHAAFSHFVVQHQSTPEQAGSRFTEGASYGIRWSRDLKNWHLIRDPALTTLEPGQVEWMDESTPDANRFYQVNRQP